MGLRHDTGRLRALLRRTTAPAPPAGNRRECGLSIGREIAGGRSTRGKPRHRQRRRRRRLPARSGGRCLGRWVDHGALWLAGCVLGVWRPFSRVAAALVARALATLGCRDARDRRSAAGCDSSPTLALGHGARTFLEQLRFLFRALVVALLRGSGARVLDCRNGETDRERLRRECAQLDHCRVGDRPVRPLGSCKPRVQVGDGRRARGDRRLHARHCFRRPAVGSGGDFCCDREVPHPLDG